jgi:tetratricopeptide (TPR) repeat protein
MRCRFLFAASLLACWPAGLFGCAAKAPIQPPYVAEMAKGEALLSDGCYTCLQQSLALFEKALTLKSPPPGAAEKAFDTALLIWLRERELSIPADDSLARARRLLIPARQPVFDAAQLIVGDTTGLDPEMRARLTGRGRPPLEMDNPIRRALDTAPEMDLAARYVALSIDCEQQKLIESVDFRAMTSNYSGVPLMRYRLATCGRPLGGNVGALREGDPRWTDTLPAEGRRELASSAGRAVDFPKVLSLYGQGREAFPASLALTMAWANANMMAEEYESAYSGFDEIVQKFPEHRDALNGKMQAQSYLMRHPEAVSTATRILELGTWNIADANYWRAWNRYHLKEYDLAWVDIQNAMKGLANARVFMLGGLIAYPRTDLPHAVEYFDTAFKMDSTQCDAVWMSGLVSIDQNDLKTAAPKFARGMTCFTSSAAALRQDRVRVEGTIEKRGTPATAREQRQLDRLSRDATNAELKSAQSAFNAAQCYARTGGKGLALNLVDVAIDHPEMREKAIALKAAIEKLPN